MIILSDAEPVFRFEGILSRVTWDVEAPPLVQLMWDSEDEYCVEVRSERVLGDEHADVPPPPPPPPPTAAASPNEDDKVASKA